MAKTQPIPSYLLQLDAKDIGMIAFKAPKDVLDWIVGEKEYWAWGQKNLHNELGLINHDRRDQIWSRLSTAQAELQKVLANPADKNALQTATGQLNEYLALGLASKTPRAKFIASLRELPEGDIVAQAALAAYVGDARNKSEANQPYQYRYPSQRGRIAMVLFDAGIDLASAGKALDTFSEVAADNKQVMVELHRSNDTALATLRGSLEEVKTANDAAHQRLSEQLAVQIEDFNNKRDAIIKTCDEAHARYSTVMELEAPYEYWTKKNEEHQKGARKRGQILFWYAFLAPIALIAVFGFAYLNAAPTDTNKFPHQALIASAALAAIVTIAFWIGRFLSRLYLSERHMAIDAKLRAVMAKTYLALASNQKVDDKDRALVLAPLFRAGSDGLVQEETGFDNALALFARALEKKALAGLVRSPCLSHMASERIGPNRRHGKGLAFSARL